MSLVRNILLKNINPRVINNNSSVRHYAIKKTSVGVATGIVGVGKKSKGKISVIKLERKEVPVETDPNRLVKFVCGTNIFAEGGQDVELKPDSEYPDWLWNLYTGPKKSLEELDPDTKEYWQEIYRLRIERIRSYRKWDIIF